MKTIDWNGEVPAVWIWDGCVNVGTEDLELEAFYCKQGVLTSAYD